MIKRSVFMVFVLAFAAVTFIYGNGGNDTDASMDEAQTFSLRLGHVTPTDFPYHIAAEEFARLVSEGTEGKVSIEIYPNAQLGNEQVLTDSLILGTLDFSLTNQAYTSSYVSEFGFLSVSYLFVSDEHVENVVLDPMFLEMMRVYTEARKPGFEYLSTVPSGVRSIYSTVPLKEFDDLQGYKIRIMPSEIETMVWNKLGTQSISVPFGEVYSALQTKLAQGAENTPAAYRMVKHYEVAPYFIKTEHQFLTVNFLASSQTMAKLPSKYLDVIRNAAIEAAKIGGEYAVTTDAAVLKELVADAGVTVIEIDKKPFIAAIAPLHAEVAESMGTDKLLDFIQSRLP